LGAEIWVPWQQPVGPTNRQAIIMAACLPVGEGEEEEV